MVQSNFLFFNKLVKKAQLSQSFDYFWKITCNNQTLTTKTIKSKTPEWNETVQIPLVGLEQAQFFKEEVIFNLYKNKKEIIYSFTMNLRDFQKENEKFQENLSKSESVYFEACIKVIFQIHTYF